MTRFLSQGIDYLGFLDAKLRDLQGYATLAHELIQNADDAQAASMSFDVRDEALVVQNTSIFSDCGVVERDECPWKEERGHRCDFHRFRKVAGGDKRGQEGTTGAFGIGFISVYQITDAPELLSGKRHWIIRPDAEETRRIEERSVEGEPFKATRFILPWALDETSPLRQRLRTQAMRSPETLDACTDELARALPNAILFLKHIRTIELRRNGALVMTVQRIDNGDQVVVQNGEEQRCWRVFRGSFKDEAATLRSTYRFQIEDKRTAQVVVAVPDLLSDLNGLLYACLPTEQHTELPFHINADFYPSNDRKHILLSEDYQGEWNRAAIAEAANVVAATLSTLPELLGREALWELLDRLKKAHDAAARGQLDPVFKTFWATAQPRIKASSVVAIWPDGWRKPDETLLLGQEEEEAALPLLNAMRLNIVHPDLRRHFALLRSINVRILGLADLVQALTKAGLDEAVELEQAPEWIRPRDARERLSQEIVILSSQQVKREVLEPAQEEIRRCAIALARDGYLRRPATLFNPAESVATILMALDCEDHLLADDNPAGFNALVETLTPAHMLSVLERVKETDRERFERLWREQKEVILGLVDWFIGQGWAVLADETLKARLRALPIWPSGESLFPLDDLYVPGKFEDPLGLASLLDRDMRRNRQDFLRELGYKRLTIERYARELVPQALQDQKTIGADARRALILLFAEELSKLRDDTETRDALSQCDLVECQDGIFRRAQSVYFETGGVLDALGEVPLARLLPDHPEAVRDLYQWLGVADEPRLADILQRLTSIVDAPPTAESYQVVARIFRHLSSRKIEASDPELQKLRGMRWLPAREDGSRWFAPNELYAVYQDYLFTSQAKFLAFDRHLQTEGRNFLELLGVQISPTTLQVVKHLQWAANNGQRVNLEVYRFLDEKADDPLIRQLRDSACLWLEGVGYMHPAYIFWSEHPFGRYRFRLTPELRKYARLCTQLEVRESPTPDDALLVLNEIAEAFWRSGEPLDAHTRDALFACWRQLNEALERGELVEDKLASLCNLPVIPTEDFKLRAPSEMFHDDRPGLAERFQNFKGFYTVPRLLGSWRAMEAAGVQPLSKAVIVTIVECDNRESAGDLLERLHTRRHLIARVAESLSANGGQPIRYSLLDTLSIEYVSRLMIDYGIRVGNRAWVSEPENVAAYFDTEHQVIYVQRRQPGRQWAALARELAFALGPQDDAVSFASGLKEVLSAETPQAADEALSELGYAQLAIDDFKTVSEGTANPRDIDTLVAETMPPNILVEEEAITLDGKTGSGGVTPARAVDRGETSFGIVDRKASPDLAGSTITESSGSSIQQATATLPSGTDICDRPSLINEEATGQIRNSSAARDRAFGGISATGASSSNRRGSSNIGGSSSVRPRDGGLHRTSSEESPQDTSKTLHRQRGRLRTYVAPARDEVSGDGAAAAQRNSEIDRAGIKRVLQYEREAGRYPEEMSHESPGFDIKSCDIDGNVLRYIEVKSVSGLWDSQGVGLSASQFNAGLLYKEQYWLYVVERAEQPDARIYRIQDPARLVDQFLYDEGWRELAEPEPEPGSRSS